MPNSLFPTPPISIETTANTDNDAIAGTTIRPTTSGAKNDPNPTKTDGDSPIYSNPCTQTHLDRFNHSNHIPTLDNTSTLSPNNTDVALSTETPAVHNAKNNSVSTQIDPDSSLYSNNTRPPAKSHFAHPNQPSILNNNTLSNSLSAPH